jgi:hypothetical protein
MGNPVDGRIQAETCCFLNNIIVYKLSFLRDGFWITYCYSVRIACFCWGLLWLRLTSLASGGRMPRPGDYFRRCVPKHRVQRRALPAGDRGNVPWSGCGVLSVHQVKPMLCCALFIVRGISIHDVSGVGSTLDFMWLLVNILTLLLTWPFTYVSRGTISKYLWNVGKLLPEYTALQPRRQPSSYSPPWEPETLLRFVITFLLLIFKATTGIEPGSSLPPLYTSTRVKNHK